MEPLTRGAASCLRSTPVGAEQTSPGRLAPVYRSYNEKGAVKKVPLPMSLYLFQSIAQVCKDVTYLFKERYYL